MDAREEQRIYDALNSLRQDVQRGFGEIRTEMQHQNGRVRKSEDRLTVIETERGIEKGDAIKRGAWAGIAAAAGLSAFVEGVKHWISK